MAAAQNSVDNCVYVYSRAYDMVEEEENNLEKKENYKEICRATLPQLEKGAASMMTINEQEKAYVLCSLNRQIAVYCFCDAGYTKKAAFLMLRQALFVFEAKMGQIYEQYTSDKKLMCGFEELLKYYQFPKDFVQKPQKKLENPKDLDIFSAKLPALWLKKDMMPEIF